MNVLLPHNSEHRERTENVVMKHTILVIEDEAELRANIAEALTLEGFEIFEADNGGTALGLLQLRYPDLILCDINLPDFDGYQILRQVRRNEYLTKVPFLFLTAKTDRDSMRKGMDLGADDYLTKPFTNDELLSAVKTRLRRHEALTRVDPEELETAKQHLTRLVAHELRTPLNSLVMVEQIISRKIEVLSKEDVQALLSSWKSGAHRLHHLVEQMVLLTQIDSGALNPKQIRQEGEIKEVGPLLRLAVGVARQFAYRHPHGRINLDQIDETLMVRCNEKALTHALAEIVSNALDFSPEGTTILMGVAKREQYVAIGILDTGPGLTTRRLERALRPFEQIDREKQEQQGIGLGLPIAKKTIEIHGGWIIFQKVASGGTKVIILLPRIASDT
jgi:two-component system, sensor histidine kinase and response regulator